MSKNDSLTIVEAALYGLEQSVLEYYKINNYDQKIVVQEFVLQAGMGKPIYNAGYFCAYELTINEMANRDKSDHILPDDLKQKQVDVCILKAPRTQSWCKHNEPFAAIEVKIGNKDSINHDIEKLRCLLNDHIIQHGFIVVFLEATRASRINKERSALISNKDLIHVKSTRTDQFEAPISRYWKAVCFEVNN